MIDKSRKTLDLMLRGPLVLQGWGYDTDGKPIPDDNDSAKNCEEGKFRNAGLKDKFLKNWLSNLRLGQLLL